MEYTGYLFAHFIGEAQLGEQVYFASSRDGLHWKDLNSGNPVLISDIGEKGVRDPFIIRDVLNGKYIIIATDLCIASGKGWWSAQHNGSTNIIVWESKDLVKMKLNNAFMHHILKIFMNFLMHFISGG